MTFSPIKVLVFGQETLINHFMFVKGRFDLLQWIGMRVIFALSLLGVSAASAFAGFLPLDPGVSLDAFQFNSNDGYNQGRGVWFQANNSFTLNGAGFFTGFSTDDAFTQTLWASDSTASDLHISNLGSFTINNPTAGDLYNNGLFAAPVNIVAGNFYYLEVTSTSEFDTTFFYNWDGPSVNLGDVTIFDGGMGGDLGNTVAPALILDIEAVPEPASMAVLGLGALALLRRKKKA